MQLKTQINNLSVLHILIYLVAFGTIWGNLKIWETKIVSETNEYRLDQYGEAFDLYQYNRARFTRRGKSVVKNLDMILQNQVRINSLLEAQVTPLNTKIKILEQKINALEKKVQQHEKNSVPRR